MLQTSLMINIGSGNGLQPDANKLLSEPMLNKFYDTIWPHKATMVEKVDINLHIQ